MTSGEWGVVVATAIAFGMASSALSCLSQMVGLLKAILAQLTYANEGQRQRDYHARMRELEDDL